MSTIDGALESFLVQLQADGRSVHSIGQYRRHVTLLREWMTAQGLPSAVDAITPPTIARFLSSPTARHRADGPTVAKKASSTNALRSSLRGFGLFLERSDLAVKNPARLVRRARCASPSPRAIGDADLRVLLDSLMTATDAHAARDHALFATLALTGARISSILGLEVENVDLDSCEIELLVTKNCEPVRLPIATALRDVLRSFIGGRTKGAVFTTARGTRLGRRHASRILQKRLTAARVARTTALHGFRHAFALRLLRETGDLLLVKSALAHRSIQSTLTYVHADRSRLKEVVQSLRGWTSGAINTR